VRSTDSLVKIGKWSDGEQVTDRDGASYVTLINKIESVQRFFIKRLNGLQSISYDDRLAM